MVSVTRHAVLRYQQRIEPVSAEDAEAAMMRSAVTIDKAHAFGCDMVVMGNGARLRLDGDKVVTVLAKRCGKRCREQ